MIKFLLFALVYVQGYVGTLKTNEARSITLNFTSNVESVIVKFHIPNIMVCVISPADLSGLSLQISDLSLSQRKSLQYDYQGFLTNSPYQLVQIDYSSTLNLKCVKFEDTVPVEVDFELYYSSSLAGGCVNDCNGYNYPNTTDSVCVEDECHCLSGSFGWFCQFQTVQIQSNSPDIYTLDPGQWQYLSYQFASTAITFTSDNTAHHNLCIFCTKIVALIFCAIAVGQYTFKLISQYIVVLDIKSSTYVDVMYIGLVNQESSTVDLSFQILTEEGANEDNSSRNEIIIIVTGCVVGSLLLFAFILSVLKSRQQRQFQIQIQEAIRRNLEQGENVSNQQRSPPRLPDKNLKGFPMRFIQDHFKGHAYEKIIKVYPGLGQFEECVVCLESMKKGTTKVSKTCSVTPCFHMFHHHCLEEWLLRQKNCPFCRTDYTRKKLIQQFPWLEVNTLRVNNSDSTYLSRMRNHDGVNESQMNLVSQVSFVPQLKEIAE